MASPAQQTDWYMDTNRKQLVTYVFEEECLVYQDGSRTPVPRSLIAQVLQTLKQSSTSSSEVSDKTITPERMTESFQNLSLHHAGDIKPDSSSKVTRALDSRFRTRSHSFFKEGKVFKVVWSEPAGNGIHGGHGDTSITTIFNEKVHSKLRWFVVYKVVKHRHCLCFPIQTHSGLGVAKRSVVKSHRAIIYTGRKEPPPMPEELPSYGEDGMLSAIRVKERSSKYPLDEMARIDFSKWYTVEFYVKAFEIGTIAEDDMQRFRNHANAVRKSLSPEEEVDNTSLEFVSSESSGTNANIGPDALQSFSLDTINIYAQHNALVEQYVASWRGLGTQASNTAADWLENASFEDQQEYFRQNGTTI